MNVLFITVDQWRGDCLSRLGHPVVQTPSLDRLAAEGVLFARHYAQATPCGPSRASLYTGMYMCNHRSVTNGTPLDARFTNVALAARANGFDPVLFGYTDTSIDPRTVGPDDRRLRTYEGILPGFRAECDLPEGNPRPWLEWLAAQGAPVDPDGAWHDYVEEPAGGGDDRYGPHRAPTQYPAAWSQTQYLTDRVIEYIDGRGTQPWFVHASFLRPHPPFYAPAPYDTMFDPESVPLPTRHATPELEADAHPLLDQFLPHEWLSGPRDLDHLRGLRAAYYAMQREVDDQLGRLFSALEASGNGDHTIVVLTSDHGEQLGDHWLMHKLGWFDQSYRVPLIVRDPRPSADGGRGTIVERFTEHVDVTPTILDLLGIEIPLQCDGRSLASFLAGTPEPDWRDEVHWEWDLREPPDRRLERQLDLTMEELSLAVLRDEHGKYVQFAGHPTLPPIFYDLDADPDELHNVAADPAYAPRVLEYAQRMLAWRMRHAERTLSGTKVTGLGVLSHRAPRR